GELEINGPSKIAIDGSLGASEEVDFVLPGGTLALGGSDFTLPGATIEGFLPGDTIDLTDVLFDPLGSATLTGRRLDVEEGGRSYLFQMGADQILTGDNFHLSADGTGGTNITILPHSNDEEDPEDNELADEDGFVVDPTGGGEDTATEVFTTPEELG